MNNRYTAKNSLALFSLLILLLLGLTACSQHPAEEEENGKDDHAGCDHAKIQDEPHQGQEHEDHAENKKEACDEGCGGHEEEKHAVHEEEGHTEHKKEGCSEDCAGHEEENHAEHEEEGHAGHGHEGHGHGESADLDKTVEELFAASCEHNIKTHTCEECRYEVGVVKVPPDIIKQGLVKLEKVQLRDFNSEVELTGEVSFDERKIAHLSPRVSGVVSRVAVDLGDTVKAGQMLVELESVDLAEGQAEYLEALAEKRLAQTALKRQQSLRDQNITSEREFLEVQRAFESAGIRANSSRQKLLRLGISEAGIGTLRRNGQSAATGKVSVNASFAGDVLKLHAVRGERIEPGAEMVFIGDTTSLWVWVDLYESQLAEVKTAMNRGNLPVSIGVRAYPGERFSGKVDFVDRVMDEHTRTVKARVTLENPEDKLKPGMFAHVRLGLDASGGRPSVPETAVLSDEGMDFVFVHHDGDYFIRRRVSKGGSAGGYLEILDGLEANQLVAVAGVFLLKSDVLRSKMGEGCAH